jgi:hypothetical protein
VSFIGRRCGDRAHTEKDDRCARHTSAEAARRALINLAARRWQPLPRMNSDFCAEQ